MPILKFSRNQRERYLTAARNTKHELFLSGIRPHHREVEGIEGYCGQRDEYKGGYFFKDEDESSWARYLHINAIKSHHVDPLRYDQFSTYIV